jgi:hypothetical protein
VLVPLLLHANEVASSDWLIDELWGTLRRRLGQDRPDLRSQLRKVPHGGDGAGPLLTRGHGYVMRVEGP